MSDVEGCVGFGGCKGLQPSRVNVVFREGWPPPSPRLPPSPRASEDKSADTSVASHFWPLSRAAVDFVAIRLPGDIVLVFDQDSGKWFWGS